MPMSKESFDYHLTPDGWIEGSADLDNGSIERPVPANRVLTVRRTEIWTSPFSSMDISTETIYESTDKDKVQELLSKYGRKR